jgi:hypothetical protein
MKGPACPCSGEGRRSQPGLCSAVLAWVAPRSMGSRRTFVSPTLHLLVAASEKRPTGSLFFNPNPFADL